MLKGKGMLKVTLVALLVGTVLMSSASADTPPEDHLAMARVAAGEDRHNDAIAHYLEAIRLKPSLRSDVSVELGNQYTWNDQAAEAIEHYEYHLLSDPNDMDAKLGIARALSWTDRLEESADYYEAMLPDAGDSRDEVLIGLARVRSWQDDLDDAEEIYSEVILEDPGNVEAHLGLAQVTNWSGKNREAESLYRAILDDEPDNTEARIGLAYAQAWQGRRDLAIETLEAGDSNERYVRMADEMNHIGYARGNHTYSFRDNTSDGDFHALRSEMTYTPEHLTEIGAAYTRGQLDLDGVPLIERHELSLIFRQRFNSVLAVSLSPGLQWNRFDDYAAPPSTTLDDEFDLFIWDAYATLTPRDWLRFDASFSRSTIDVPRPVFREIYVTTESLSMDWRWAHRLLTVWQLSHSDFSDHNRRVAVSGRVDWTPPVRVRTPWQNHFVVTGGAGYWDMEMQSDNGYFSPLSLATLYSQLRYVTDIGSRTTVDVAGRLGLEKENSGDWNSTGSFEANVTVGIANDVSLRAGYSTSGSRLDSADGFRSKYFYISLDYLLGK
jgi:Tfp pilus assembly protein PilF